LTLYAGFLRCFRGPNRVPRIKNRVPRISENYHRVPRIRENRVPIIREIGSLQINTGYLTFSLLYVKWTILALLLRQCLFLLNDKIIEFSNSAIITHIICTHIYSFMEWQPFHFTIASTQMLPFCVKLNPCTVPAENFLQIGSSDDR